METRPPISELNFRAVRSRGPGGQNVNKVASAAILYWDFMSSAVFSEYEKKKIARKLESAINAEGVLHLRSDETRDLQRNKALAYEKLLKLVQKALFVPKPRKKTKPTRAQKEKRLKSKSRRSEIKSARQKIRHID